MFVRFAICTVLLTPVLIKSKAQFPRGKLLFKLIGLGCLVYFSQSIAYFYALSLIPAGLASLLLYLYPAIVALLAVTILREKISKPMILALVLALIGVSLTLGSRGMDAGIDRRGVMLGLIAAVLYAGFIVFGTKLLRKAPAIVTSWIVFASTAAVYGIIMLIDGPQWPQGVAGWLGTLGLGISSTIAITSFLAGLSIIGPVTTSTLSVLEPVVTIILAAALFGDKMSALQLVGGLLILSAAIILARSAARGQVG
jgi:drug/metabolite transporter (DMT)-like permease